MDLDVESDTKEVTALLLEWGEGDRAALDELIPIVQVELRRIARSFMRRERPGHTLQTSALINEAYVKLVDQNRVHWQNRTQFFAICAKLMRRVLLDHARRRNAKKRGEGKQVTLPDVLPGGQQPTIDLMDLENGLQALEDSEPRQAQLVELRYYGDLTIPEVAEVTGKSPSTVKRDLTHAKEFLQRYLEEISSASQEDDRGVTTSSPGADVVSPWPTRSGD